MIDWWKINISDKKNQIQLLNSLKRKNIILTIFKSKFFCIFMMIGIFIRLINKFR